MSIDTAIMKHTPIRESAHERQCYTRAIIFTRVTMFTVRRMIPA
jgi:hypothetical protein